MDSNDKPKMYWEGSKPGKVIDVKLLGFKKLAFTHHALSQMKIRRIREDEVIDAIRSPEEVGLNTHPGRERVRKWRNSKTAIDVVYEIKSNSIRVITAIKSKREQPGKKRRRQR